MNNCFKCIHYDVCTKWRKPALYGITTHSGCDNHFIAKSNHVEVVRCKDCKHYLYDDFDGCYVCMQLSKYVKTDFWCAYGERKDNAV